MCGEFVKFVDKSNPDQKHERRQNYLFLEQDRPIAKEQRVQDKK
jgi:hypothetical protein